MKNELQKQLHEAELEKLRAIDKIKQIKAQIEKSSKEPSIYELMPIGSVWCGWKVVTHCGEKSYRPIGLTNYLIDFIRHPQIDSLHKLIAEQKKIDAMKKAADAAVEWACPALLTGLWESCQDYKNIVEQEAK